MAHDATIQLTPEALQTMIATAVATAIQESKKPAAPTERELADLEQAQEYRASQAKQVIQTMENKRSHQLICVHEHDKRAGGGTHGVWVKEEDPRSPGFIYCQKCEARIRPGNYDKTGLPYQMDRGAIFDTSLFNKLFQECGDTSLMG